MQQLRKSLGYLVVFSLTILLLTACGGGGGGESSPADTTPPSLGLQPATPITKAAEQTLTGTNEAGVTVAVTTSSSAQAGQVVFTSTTTWECTVTGLAEGENVITIKATDAAGNVAVKTVTITRDTTPPAVIIGQFTTPTAQRTQTVGGTMETGAVVSVTLDPAGGTIGTVAVNGAAWSCPLSNLTDGVHTLIVTATDTAGNAATASVVITIDATAPAFALDPFISPSRNPSLALTGTVDAQSTVTVAVNTAATAGVVTYPTPTTWQSLITNLPEGASIFTVTAADAVGNTATATATITVDLTPPTVTATSPLNGATEVPVDIHVTATFSEPVDNGLMDTATFLLTDTNGDPVTGTVGYNPTTRTATFIPSIPLAVGGTYTANVTIAAADLAGNALTLPAVWSFDTTTTVAPPPPPLF